MGEAFHNLKQNKLQQNMKTLSKPSGRGTITEVIVVSLDDAQARPFQTCRGGTAAASHPKNVGVAGKRSSEFCRVGGSVCLAAHNGSLHDSESIEGGEVGAGNLDAEGNSRVNREGVSVSVLNCSRACHCESRKVDVEVCVSRAGVGCILSRAVANPEAVSFIRKQIHPLQAGCSCTSAASNTCGGCCCHQRTENQTGEGCSAGATTGDRWQHNPDGVPSMQRRPANLKDNNEKRFNWKIQNVKFDGKMKRLLNFSVNLDLEGGAGVGGEGGAAASFGNRWAGHCVSPD